MEERPNHESVSKRSRKGVSWQKVTHRHAAYVTGPDPFRDQDDDVRPDMVREDMTTLAAQADAFARLQGCEDFPAIIGTPLGLSWEQMVDASEDGENAALLAIHHTDLFGGMYDDLRVGMAGQAQTIRRTFVRPVVKPRARMALPTPRKRKAEAWSMLEPVTCTCKQAGGRVHSHKAGATLAGKLVTFGDQELKRTPVPTQRRTAVRRAPAETLFVGHDARMRPTSRAQSRTPRAAIDDQRRELKRQAAKTSDAGAAIVEAFDHAAPGDTVEVLLPGDARVTFTRPLRPGVPSRWVLDIADERVATSTARTGSAIAMRVAAKLA